MLGEKNCRHQDAVNGLEVVGEIDGISAEMLEKASKPEVSAEGADHCQNEEGQPVSASGKFEVITGDGHDGEEGGKMGPSNLIDHDGGTWDRCGDEAFAKKTVNGGQEGPEKRDDEPQGGVGNLGFGPSDERDSKHD